MFLIFLICTGVGIYRERKQGGTFFIFLEKEGSRELGDKMISETPFGPISWSILCLICKLKVVIKIQEKDKEWESLSL